MNSELKLVYDDDDEEDSGEWDEEEDGEGREVDSAGTTRKPHEIILDDVDPYPESLLGDSDPLKVTAAAGGVFLCSSNEKVEPFQDNRGRAVQPKKVYWMTELKTFSRVKSAYAAFGNHGGVWNSCRDL